MSIYLEVAKGKILRLARNPTIMKASNNQLHFLQ